MKTLYALIDTETCGSLEHPYVYNFAYSVIDAYGFVYEQGSFINRDIFVGFKDLMDTAYYANKIPQYRQQIWDNEIQVANWYEIKSHFWDVCDKYNIKAVIAHNARFDFKACNNTQRLKTYAPFFHPNVEIWDTLLMARDTIGKQKRYLKFCNENQYLTANGKPRMTAEILYRYITKNNDFVEAHTALEDVNI